MFGSSSGVHFKRKSGCVEVSCATCWFWYAVTVVNTVSGKEKVRVPSPAGMALTGDNSSPHSLLITWTRGWYLCIECRMIWTREGGKKFFQVLNDIIAMLFTAIKQDCWIMKVHTWAQWCRYMHLYTQRNTHKHNVSYHRPPTLKRELQSLQLLYVRIVIIF